jgi:hypothetical protein
MKKAILYFSLAMITLFTATASAQFTAQIGVNPPSIQNGYLIFSGFAVNSTAGAEVWGELKVNNQQFTPLQNVIVPNPGTAVIVAHQIATSTFHNGDVYRFRVKMFDGGPYALVSDVVAYRVRKRCGFGSFGRDAQRTTRLLDQLPHESIMIHITGDGPKSNLIDLMTGEMPDNVSISDDLMLEKLSDEELLKIDTKVSIQDVVVKTWGTAIDFQSPDASMKYSYTLYDLSGKKIFFDTVVGSSSVTILGLSSGIYVVVLTDDATKESVSKKIPLEY